MAKDTLDKLKSGHTSRHMIKSVGGQVYEATDFRIGADHYASVRVDISRLHEQAELIRTQKSRLEASNEKLERFSMLAAHDLKAPLQQQAGLLAFLNEDLEPFADMLPDDVVAYLETMTLLTDRMGQLVEDLLDHAKADVSNQMPQSLRPTDRLAEILPILALPAGFRVDAAPDIPEVTAAPAAFDAVLRNLISNAVKHHHRAEGTVTITGHMDGTQAVIEVTDDGPGIPAIHRSRIFEPFQRLSTDRQGSGLGLSFIQKTVKSWGGQIEVADAPGGGSVFRFTVPSVAPALLNFAVPRTGLGRTQ